MVMSEKPKTDRQTLLIPLGNIHIHIFKWTETLILIFSQLWFEKWFIQLKTGQNMLAVKVDMPVLIWVFFGGKEKNEIKKTNTICHNHTIYKNIKHTSKTVQLVDQGTLFSNLQTVCSNHRVTLSTLSSPFLALLMFVKTQLRQIENWITAPVFCAWSPSPWFREWQKSIHPLQNEICNKACHSGRKPFVMSQRVSGNTSRPGVDATCGLAAASKQHGRWHLSLSGKWVLNRKNEPFVMSRRSLMVGGSGPNQVILLPSDTSLVKSSVPTRS